MKILLSPAKSLDENIEFNEKYLTQPEFSAERERLVKKMQKLSIGQIGKLMHISADLASLNYDRYQAWPETLNKSTAYPAGLVFNGAAYLGLSFATLSEEEQLRGQNQLRILSGLYGLLKPFDLIYPYRLEMGTSLKVTPKITNLYKFWGEKIHNKILTEMEESEDSILVNLASSEYSKAALLNKMSNIQVITPVFKDRNKAGIYKMNMHFAKTARGLMTRYILQENIKEVTELKAFDTNGYRYAENDSTANEFVFLRD
ncbi:peroxide stress protein YaaA [Crocinitomix catalasitica]|uniref:peroxide stress protein YaaA n=1 Tax=Crocinitomix catalasitica TaxID=184607 RepID=UPI0004839B8F|nr:peroxide stress protein YaaA [Crocinitomix catalasitica]